MKKISVDYPTKRFPISPAELAQDIAKRIRDAAEMGDVTTLNAIAEEIKTHSDACVPAQQTDYSIGWGL